MLVFKNRGLINITAMTVSGVSAKTNEGAIGIFGTGMKYAIAVILRLGGSVVVHAGRRSYEFGVKRRVVREQSFDVVTMNGRELGYTTRMGLNWEPWMAYRELWSNAMDEGGSVARVSADDDDARPKSGETRIVVSCRELELAHDDRDSIVVRTEPIDVVPGVLEFHSGRSSVIFYRGIRALDIEEPSMLRYSVLETQQLTEDRTIKSTWYMPSLVGRAIMKSSSEAVIRTVMDVRNRARKSGVEVSKVFESRIPWSQLSSYEPSERFMKICQELRESKNLVPEAGALFSELTDRLPGYVSDYTYTPTAVDAQVLREAAEIVLARTRMAVRLDKIQFRTRGLPVGRNSQDEAGLIINASRLREGAPALARTLLIGAILLRGGSVDNQLARLVLGEELAPASEARQEFEKEEVTL